MKKSLANQICKLWNDNFAGSTPETRTQAEVTENATGYAVEVKNVGAENDGYAFFAHEEITDIERAFRVNAYITQDENHRLYARIY